MHDDDKTPDAEASRDGAALPRAIQEHLGRRLRTELHIEAEKPSFLGEPSLPPQFETLVRKIEAGENGERQGYEAVKRAIVGTTPEPPPVEMQRPPSTSPLRPRIPKRPL